MNGRRNRSSEILENPHINIGAQDLLRTGEITQSGFLRKRGRLERIVQSIRPLAIILPGLAKWRQRFVILARGCLYVYPDELSSRPLQAVSLRGYSKVERFDLNKEEDEPEEIRKRSFIIEPANTTQKTFIFACAKDHERKEWMGKLKEEMLKANGLNTGRSGSCSSDADFGDYVYLETEVIPKVEPPPPRPTKPQPLSQGKTVKTQKLPRRPDSESESDSETSDYDQINDLPEDVRNKRRQPPGKRNSETTKNRPSSNVSRKSSSDEYLLNESDRTKVESILSAKGQGTFLVRKSRQGDTKVLSVQTSEGMKEYKIFAKENGFTIDNTKYFKTMEELIVFYKTSSLPNRTLTLSRGYRS